VQAALGELYGAEGRYDEAIRLLEAALTSVPDANRLYYPLALAFRGRGDHEKARELMTRRGSVGLKPVDPVIDPLMELKTGERAYLLSGQTAFRAGRYEEAVTAFRKAVAAAPDSVAARVNLGSALGEMGDLEAALAEYDRALEIAPENPTALFNAGRLRASRGEVEVALVQLRSAAENAPEDVSIRLQLADLLSATG
ncbi:MAG: tetratricopeptide repeat protein, partial [Acidobacteriota bacterium]